MRRRGVVKDDLINTLAMGYPTALLGTQLLGRHGSNRLDLFHSRLAPSAPRSPHSSPHGDRVMYGVPRVIPLSCRIGRGIKPAVLACPVQHYSSQFIYFSVVIKTHHKKFKYGAINTTSSGGLFAECTPYKCPSHSFLGLSLPSQQLSKQGHTFATSHSSWTPTTTTTSIRARASCAEKEEC